MEIAQAFDDVNTADKALQFSKPFTLWVYATSARFIQNSQTKTFHRTIKEGSARVTLNALLDLLFILFNRKYLSASIDTLFGWIKLSNCLFGLQLYCKIHAKSECYQPSSIISLVNIVGWSL